MKKKFVHVDFFVADPNYGFLLSVILFLGPADVFVLREAVPVCRRSEEKLLLF